MNKDVSLHIRIDKELKDRIEKEARKELLSSSTFVRIIISKEMNRRESND